MIKDKVPQILNYLKGLKDNSQVLEDVEFFTFFITLLPIPGLQQAGQIANKIVADKNLNLKFNKIKQEILDTNSKILTLETELDKVQTIASTVSIVTKIEEDVNEFVTEINKESSEFIVETEKWSTQTIINQIINSDFTSISAINQSHNVLKNVKINSTRTHLKASDHSSNYIEGTEFKGHEGSIRMDGIAQKGNMQVKDSSLIFGSGGQIIFGTNRLKKAICPCGNELIARESDLRRQSTIQCPRCEEIFNIFFN